MTPSTLTPPRPVHRPLPPADRVAACADVVRGICAQRLGRRELDDLTQEVFARALASLGRLHDRASLPAYVCRIAHNLCTDRLRRRARPIEGRTLSLDDLEAEIEDRTEPADPDIGLLRMRLRAGLERLPPRQREVVVRFHLQGMSYAEAAEAMGATVPAINQLLSRARSRLRAALGVAAPA